MLKFSKIFDSFMGVFKVQTRACKKTRFNKNCNVLRIFRFFRFIGLFSAFQYFKVFSLLKYVIHWTQNTTKEYTKIIPYTAMMDVTIIATPINSCRPSLSIQIVNGKSK